MAAKGQKNRIRAPGKPVAPGTLAQHSFKISLDSISKICGGKAGFIDMARHSDDSQTKAVIEIWDGLSKSEKNRMSLEQLCDKAGVAPRWFLSEVVSNAWEIGVEVTKLITAVMLPKVVEKTARVALTTAGDKDRKLFLEGARFKPGPVNQFAIFEQNAGQGLKEEPAPELVETTAGLPALEDGNALDAQFESIESDSPPVDV